MPIKTQYHEHLHVDDVQKISNESFATNAILFDSTLPTVVYGALKAAVESGDDLAAIKAIAAGYLDTADIFNSNAELNAVFPDFVLGTEQLAKGNFNLAEIKSLVPETAVSDTDLGKLWDTLFTYYTLNHRIAEFELGLLIIRVIHLMEFVYKTGSMIAEDADVKNYWKRARALFPNPPFPLKRNNKTGPTPPYGQSKANASKEPEIKPVADTYAQAPNDEEALSNVEVLEKTRQEIIDLFELQTQALKPAKLDKDEFTKQVTITAHTTLEKERDRAEFEEVDIDKLYEKYLAQVDQNVLTPDSVANLSKKATAALGKLGVDPGVHVVPFLLAAVEAAIREQLGAVADKPKPGQVILIGSTLVTINDAVFEDIICEPEATLDHCALLQQLNGENPPESHVQILGTGCVNVVKQELLRYEADEIANIETVLAGESKTKSHRDLKRTEEFVSIETSSSVETETDQRTSERFEVAKESSNIVNQASQLEAGVSLTASYGTVSVTAGLGYASQNSSSSATATAVNTSKEISNRAVKRIQERSSELRSTLTINEVEIIASHEINNAANTNHVNGFYYWVDKVYENQVHNLGKRLMIEFMVPEPAAYHVYSQAKSGVEGVSIDKPIAPNDYTDKILQQSLTSSLAITRSNYHLWAAIYGAQNVPIAPLEFITISKSYSLDPLPEAREFHDKNFNELEIKEGYQASYGNLQVGFSSGDRYVSGFLGSTKFSVETVGTHYPIVVPLSGETDLVPFSFRGKFTEYIINVEIFCKLSEAGMRKWQQDAYNAVLGAYNQQLSEYNNQVARAELDQGVAIQGDNPIVNRQTEQTELKKWGIELLTLQRFDGFNAMKRATDGAPEIDFTESYLEGQFVRFFEQAIEWSNMTYKFYPYFWAKKPRWTILKQFQDTDHKFQSFLQAGYARVVVPIHPKFNEAFLHYMSTGEIWLGGELPAIDDDLYMSIIDEIQLADGAVDGTPVGDPWETRIPTNLVMLTGDIPSNLPGS
jgi:hypothetical protein